MDFKEWLPLGLIPLLHPCLDQPSKLTFQLFLKLKFRNNQHGC